MASASAAKTEQDILNKARAAWFQGDYEKAENIITSYGDLFLGNPDAFLILGNVFQKTDRSDKAEAAYRQILEIDPGSGEALNNLGILYRRMGRIDEAIGYLEQALSYSPDRVDIHYNLGNLNKVKGNLDKAEEHYLKALELDPGYIPGYNNLGTIYESLKQFEKAREIYSRGLNHDPKNPLLLYNLGLISMEEGNWKQARTDLERVMKSKPGWVSGLINLGISYQNLGRLDHASQIFDEVLKKEPENTVALNNMGAICALKGDLPTARNLYKKAIDIDPAYKKAVFNLQEVNRREEFYEESLKELNKLATRHPNDIEVQVRIGETLLGLGQFKEAGNSLSRVLERDPKNIRARKALCEHDIRTGKLERAESILKKIIRDNPDDTEFLLKTAGLYHDNYRFEEAEKLLKRILSIKPADINARRLLARTLSRMSRLKEAADQFETLDPNEEDMVTIAEIQNRLGNRDKALEKLDSLINLLGSRGNVEDLDKLNQYLSLYDETASALEKDNSALWERNLTRFREITIGEQAIVAPSDAGFSTTFRPIPVDDEDAISLLEMNSMEPVIQINEEEETVYLESDQEDLLDNYTELLDDEEIVDDPWLKRRPQAPAQSAPSAPAIPFSMSERPFIKDAEAEPPRKREEPPQETFPRRPERRPPEEDYESEPEIIDRPVESSAKESPGKAAREAKETRQAMQAALMSAQASAAQAAQAAAQSARQQQPGYSPQLVQTIQTPSVPIHIQPGGVVNVQMPSKDARIVRNEESPPVSDEPDIRTVDLEDLIPDEPEDVQDLEEEVILPEESPAEIELILESGPGEEESSPEPEQSEDFSQEEPEHEEPELLLIEEEEILEEPEPEEMEEEPPEEDSGDIPEFLEVPEPEPPEEHLEEEPEILPEEPEAAPEKEELSRDSVINMLNYLKGLSRDLPEKKKEEMMERSVPLKIACLTSKLSEGDRSLWESASLYDRRRNERSRIALDKAKLKKTLEFFKSLAGTVTEQDVSQTLELKVNEIKGKIRNGDDENHD